MCCARGQPGCLARLAHRPSAGHALCRWYIAGRKVGATRANFGILTEPNSCEYGYDEFRIWPKKQNGWPGV